MRRIYENLILLLQEQAEEIAALKVIVQEQKDEINKLKNMPKRPKFRPGGGNKNERSGKPRVDKENSSPTDNGLSPKKASQERIF